MGARILVVEDSPALADVIRTGLAKSGYEVFVVHNGFEALRDLDQIAPDLILTDINMPKLDGLKLCWGIQNRMETKTIPFILLSSQIDEETLAKGKDLGACHFIAKPFKIERVVECIKEALGE